MTHTLEIPGWMPARLNELIHGHWAKGAKLKKRDREIVSQAAYAHKTPYATEKRRVSVLIVLPSGKRAPDPDSLWKSLLDALVATQALRNDSPAWCELGRVRFARGEELVTYLTLESV